MDLKKALGDAKSFGDIFYLVKAVVKNYLGADQAGLLLGLSDLGTYGNAYLGAFYSLDANTIIINKRILNVIKHSRPEIYNPYIFHILLHEYLHSLGIFDEEDVSLLVFEITKKNFGGNHLATQIAFDAGKFIPNFTLGEEIEVPEDMSIEFISGIDRDNTDYIM